MAQMQRNHGSTLDPLAPPPYHPLSSAAEDTSVVNQSRRLRSLVRAALDADEASGGIGGREVVDGYLRARRELLAACSNCGDDDSLKQLATSLLEKVDSRLSNLGVELPTTRASDDSNEQTVAATELFRLPGGVRLYFVSPDGRVRHSGSDNRLSLCVFEDASVAPTNDGSGRPPAFISVGDSWQCPLIPNVTPVLASSGGALIFPNVDAVDQSSSVGLILPEQLDFNSRMLLLDLLACLSRLGIERPSAGSAPTATPAEKPPLYTPEPGSTLEEQKPPARRTSDHLVSGISWTAARLSEGAVVGGRIASDLITKARIAAQKRMKPADESASAFSYGNTTGHPDGITAGNSAVNTAVNTSSERTNLDNVASGFYLLRQGSAIGVRVSRRLVSGLATGASYLATRVVYPHAVAPALNAVGVSTSANRDENSRLAGAARVAGAAIVGAANVWDSLGAAGSQLANCFADNGQALAAHRWGQRAGAVTGDALHAGGNIARIAWVTNGLGVRGAMKLVALETGKETIGKIAATSGAPVDTTATSTAASTSRMPPSSKPSQSPSSLKR